MNHTEHSVYRHHEDGTREYLGHVVAPESAPMDKVFHMAWKAFGGHWPAHQMAVR
jgi:hypothetical protein